MRYLIFLGVITLSFNALSAQKNQSLVSLLTWDTPPIEAKQSLLESANNYKIFWWNIGCGNTASDLKAKDGKESLYSNISLLAQNKQSPDLLILGEHCPTPMPASIKKILQKFYPHSHHLLKSNPYGKINNGLIVFSKFPLELISQKNLEVGSDEAETKLTTRTYLLFKVTSPKGDLYLCPVHLYNPWRKYTFAELIFKAMGTDNVNYKQAELLMQFLKEDLEIEKDPLIVIGDFNSAKNFFLFNSMASYSLFSNYFSDGDSNEFTYPSSGAQELGNSYPALLIDHAFSTASFSTKTIMLQMRGSDHYPLLMSF